MASKTDIANRALSKLGEQRVSNVDTDNSKAAKVIRYMFDIVRDEMIAKYPWNFAIERAQIAKDSASPAWGFDNRYALPVDFLSLLEIKGKPKYKIEGRYIVTNDNSPIFIRYIKRVVNTGDFDPVFVETFSSRLAYEGCEEITQSNTKKEALWQELQMNIKDAYASDAIQELPEDLEPDEWLIARVQGYHDDIDYSTAGS